MVAKSSHNKNSFSKRELIISIFFAFVFIGLVALLITANYKINDKREKLLIKINELKKEIQATEEKNRQLNKDINQADSKEQLEKIAREEMGLKKPGEEVVVIKDNSDKSADTAGGESDIANVSGASPENNVNNFWNPVNWWNWLTGK